MASPPPAHQLPEQPATALRLTLAAEGIARAAEQYAVRVTSLRDGLRQLEAARAWFNWYRHQSESQLLLELHVLLARENARLTDLAREIRDLEKDTLDAQQAIKTLEQELGQVRARVGVEESVRRKTIVELDLVGFSDLARRFEQNLGVYAVEELKLTIQRFVDVALSSVGVSRHPTVITKKGDNALLAFDRADVAFSFVEAFYGAVEAHNCRFADPALAQIYKRWFRIGTATGDVVWRLERDGSYEASGVVIADAVRLEAACTPGELLVDAATFSALLPEQQRRFAGGTKVVHGKHTTEVYHAHCCILLPTAGAEALAAGLWRPK